MSDVMTLLLVDQLLDQALKTLSGGAVESRRGLALLYVWGSPLISIREPSAYLDSEQRITASKVIKRFLSRKENRRCLPILLLLHFFWGLYAQIKPFSNVIVVTKGNNFSNDLKSIHMSILIRFSSSILQIDMLSHITVLRVSSAVGRSSREALQPFVLVGFQPGCSWYHGMAVIGTAILYFTFYVWLGMDSPGSMNVTDQAIYLYSIVNLCRGHIEECKLYSQNLNWEEDKIYCRYMFEKNQHRLTWHTS
ncbi:unnamed protein product [Arabidopsis lyrata]|uniref:Uncharacterized protein n=1 Tax=Arabidopsis lyrata subsp. lyrata TaxID=81972 RepID=D7KC80_ARALL|nr:hypothetical protein ARALYDRAFT_892904 [Arabidopsis lyrata subsp. lyrata]CAH8256621.1 unnamed protein product [Arabidopsis lyrata]